MQKRQTPAVLLLIAALAVAAGREAGAQGAGEAVSAAVSDAISSAVIRSVQDANGQVVSAYLHDARLRPEAPTGRVDRLVRAADRNSAILTFENGAQRAWDFISGVQHLLSASGVGRAIGHEQSMAWVIDRSGRLLRTSAGSAASGVSGAAPSDLALQTGPGSAVIIRGRSLDIVSMRGEDATVTGTVALSGQISEAWAMGGNFVAIRQGGEIHIIDADDGTAVERFGGPAGSARVLDVRLGTTRGLNPTLMALDLGSKVLVRWDEGVAMQIDVGGRVRTGAFDPDEETVTFLLEGGRIVQHDRSGRRLLDHRLRGGRRALDALPFLGGTRVAVLLEDGGLDVIDRESSEPLVSAYSTRSGWLAVDRFGRYDAPSGDASPADWELGAIRIPLERMARGYFEPGLLARYLSGETRSLISPAFDTRQGLPLPPTVQSMQFLPGKRRSSAPVSLLVTARGVGNAIEGLELFHNGRRVSPRRVISDESGGRDVVRVRSMVFNVEPAPGVNTFAAVPIGLGSIEGETVTLSEAFVGDPEPADLHVLAVGINRYNLGPLRLGYAASDASSIGRILASGRSLHRRRHTTALIDRDARIAGIRTAFADLAARAGEGDTAVIYLAGHGIISDGKWRFIAQDISATDQHSIRRSSLSAEDLVALLEPVAARNVVLILDTCYSGAVASEFSRFGVRRASSIISRKTGLAVLAASRADQEALEIRRLRAGLFSFTIARGIEGEADLNRDTLVSARELVTYAGQTLPELFRRHLGEIQHPVALFRGTDFPLAVAGDRR